MKAGVRNHLLATGQWRLDLVLEPLPESTGFRVDFERQPDHRVLTAIYGFHPAFPESHANLGIVELATVYEGSSESLRRFIAENTVYVLAVGPQPLAHFFEGERKAELFVFLVDWLLR